MNECRFQKIVMPCATIYYICKENNKLISIYHILFGYWTFDFDIWKSENACMLAYIISYSFSRAWRITNSKFTFSHCQNIDPQHLIRPSQLRFNVRGTISRPSLPGIKGKSLSKLIPTVTSEQRPSPGSLVAHDPAFTFSLLVPRPSKRS